MTSTITPFANPRRDGRSRRWQERNDTTRRNILAFISGHYAQHGFSPSLREIGEAVGLASTNSVHKHLLVLAAGNQLKYTQGKSRSIVLPRKAA